MTLRPRHVRARLTLWYVGVLGGVLLLFVAGTSAFFFWTLRQGLDHRLREDVETVEGLLSFGQDGSLRMSQEHRDEPAERGGRPQELIEVRDASGAVLFRNEVLGGDPSPQEGLTGYWERSSRLGDGTRVRLVSRRHTTGGHSILVRVAHSEEPLWSQFQQLVSAMLLALPAGLLVAGLGGYGLARRALAPIDAMARQAEKINAEHLHARLPVENPDDELGHLASVFNATLARLEGSFHQLSRFTADASHELRTPLTAIRSVGEVGLQREGDSAYYRDIIGSMLEEVARLTRLVENLLALSRADAGSVQLRRAATPLLPLAREAAALVEILADEKGQRLTVEGDASATAYVDPLILRQALVNLIDNGIKYSPMGGSVRVHVEAQRGQSLVEIADTGPGIASEDQQKIFERFYRVDQSRARNTGGAGLGLPIVRWAVEANGGALELESRQGQGSTFRIKLPVECSSPAPGSQTS
jgi:heavy metal sensor kinase